MPCNSKEKKTNITYLIENENWRNFHDIFPIYCENNFNILEIHLIQKFTHDIEKPHQPCCLSIRR